MTCYRVDSLKRAEKLCELLKSQGVDAYVMQEQCGLRRAYRVMVRE